MPCPFQLPNYCWAGLQDREVLPLIRDGAIWTLGADTADLDWEAMWRNRLANDNYQAKGRSGSTCVLRFDSVDTHIPRPMFVKLKLGMRDGDDALALPCGR